MSEKKGWENSMKKKMALWWKLNFVYGLYAIATEFFSHSFSALLLPPENILGDFFHAYLAGAFEVGWFQSNNFLGV